MTQSLQLGPILDWLYGADPLADPVVERQARLLFLDTLGCMVAGLAKPELRAFAAAAAALESGTVRLPGTDAALVTAAAAETAAMAACWDEACEGLARAHGRPGLHSFPPALVLGLARRTDLGHALAALATGFEVAGRLGESLRILKGMHVDGTWGTFGAVAAAARLAVPDPASARHAAGIAIQAAACQLPYSLYLPVAEGATARNSYVAHAQSHALLQVGAALAGVTAPAGAVEAFDALALGRGDGEHIPLAPAGEWLILQGYLKPYAAVRHVHYGAAAAAEWHRRHGGRTDGITALTLRVYEEGRTYCGNRAPATAIQAQFSLTYGLAWTLIHGDLGPDAYDAAALADPEVRRLEALIALETDAALTAAQRRGATLTVRTAAGDESIAADAVPGDAAMPLSPEAVRDKFRRYAAPHLGDGRAAAIADAVLDGPLGRPLDEVLRAIG